MRSPCTARKSSPRSPQLKKARVQQRRPNAAKKRKKKEFIVISIINLGNQKFISIVNALCSLLKFENNSDVKILILCILIYHHSFPCCFSPRGGINSWFMSLFPSNEHIYKIEWFDLICFYFWDLGSLMFNFPVSFWKVFKISVNWLSFSRVYNLSY